MFCIKCGKNFKKERSFCPSCGTKKVDVDGNEYRTVKLGNKIWMTEDLRVTKFNDGTDIPVVPCPECWKNLKTPAMCYYDNDKDKNVLYNFYAVDTGKLAPKGWHVPTDEEWSQIKSKEQINLLPSGCRSFNGAFYFVGYGGTWWSTTAYDASNSWYRYMNYGSADVGRDDDDDQNGFSVRCVRDH